MGALARCGALTACALVVCVGCGASEVTPLELCADAESLVGREVIVRGTPTPGAVTLLTTTIVYCTPPSCCNSVWYAPAFACPSGTTIYVTPPRPILWTSLRELDFVCATRSEGSVPTTECPLEARCESLFGRVSSLRGTLVRRADATGTQQLFLEVSSSSATPIDDAGASSD